MGRRTKTVRTYSKRCPKKVLEENSRLTTPETQDENSSIKAPQTPSYLKDISLFVNSNSTSHNSRKTSVSSSL